MSERRPSVQTLARLPNPLSVNGIATDRLGNIIVAVWSGSNFEDGAAFLQLGPSGQPAKQLDLDRELVGVCSIALSPEGEELYVLTHQEVWLFRAPWGSHPGERVLTGLDDMSPEPLAVLCYKPG
jgi:hypothetical protein